MTIQDLQKYGQLYNQWKESFPFDLPYFSAFKDRLEHMPNKLIGKPSNSNNFLIWTKPDVKDEVHFIERLTQLTGELLDHVQIEKLRQKAIIDTVEETRLTLSGEKLRIKNDALIQGISSNEMKYVDLLENWIDCQINYFRENEDIFKRLTEQDAAWSNWTQEGEREFYKNKFYKDLKESPLDEIDFIDRELKRINLTLEQCSLGHTQETENLSAVKERNYNIHKEWLQARKKKLVDTEDSKSDNQEFSLNQIALIYIYKDESITRDNGSSIAKSYGYDSKTSGEKLYQNFTHFINASNRKGDEGTKRKNTNKLNLLESVLESLPDHKREKAKDEITILNSIINSQY